MYDEDDCMVCLMSVKYVMVMEQVMNVDGEFVCSAMICSYQPQMGFMFLVIICITEAINSVSDNDTIYLHMEFILKV